MVDNYRHKGMRKRLVNEIRSKGVKDQRILDAVNKIPRHLFLDSSFLEFAYEDKPFPIGSGQTISQPYTVAFQTELLEVKKGQKILEIGTGSGYQACVLAELGAKVFSIERQKKLYEKTKVFLPKIGYRQIKLFYGDGYKGVPAFAPYDGILITAAAPEIPEKLVSQLKTGGVIVLPLGGGDVQTMLRLTKKEDGTLQEEQFGAFRFVPLLKNKSSD
ncbi:MAG: protein-L-isoaspartate O-methyltransferase [Bacteroidetes bacterium]|nr:MAG: protein-L-isoaspartate O-methyltransferase [Bacteroidota bacterium]RLD49125.1 MAG: protein-L-isoaspartate O-methyltransferase [Bacteroidota bacterium]RLD74439.1 MAG: protein-L-isoaspartate O-methyltransferase [Bacteroidota bacterium]RLD88790.1 MAG: protein-L-isoaspartate O-methyltransferase [Bacteroidota bacterium]